MTGQTQYNLLFYKELERKILFKRRKTRQIHIGEVPIGGNAPISVQSMTKTDTRDTQSTLKQVKTLEDWGCEIVRLAVPDKEAVESLQKIKREAKIPVIADIHFDHRLALEVLKKGIDGLRINPGNIGSREKVEQVVREAKGSATPIRIGVNSGSLERELLKKYGGATPEALIEGALGHVRILEDLNFDLIKISLKASDVFRTLKAYRLMAEKVDYPFHVGITEAGGLVSGSVKSSVGLTLLLEEGVGDTVRVSLTAPPQQEIRVAYLILSQLGLRSRGINLISCPVCGRCEVDFFHIFSEIEKKLSRIKEPVNVAVMGCVVNGPGEAKEADIGVACGRGVGVFFKKGKPYRKVKEKDIVPQFVEEVERLIEEKKLA